MLNSWVLSIVGIVCVGVIVDIIIPSGQVAKYIKIIFSLITVFVIVSPITKFIGSDFDLTEYFQLSNYEIDSNFIQKINVQKCENLKESIMANFSDNEIEVESVDVVCDAFNEEFVIMSIYVEMPANFSSKTEKERSNTRQEIISLIMKIVDVSKEVISFND